MAVHSNHITVAKALGIILMVIGHSGCPQLLFRSIYLFHMPLFFFCSGIFFKEMTTTQDSPFSISAMSGTMLTLYVSDIIEKKCPAIKSALYYIGNHTLDILALHFLSFRFVSYVIVVIYGINVSHIAEHPVIKDVSVPHALRWILYCIVGVVLPLLLNYVWKMVVNTIKIKIQ